MFTRGYIIIITDHLDSFSLLIIINQWSLLLVNQWSLLYNTPWCLEKTVWSSFPRTATAVSALAQRCQMRCLKCRKLCLDGTRCWASDFTHGFCDAMSKSMRMCIYIYINDYILNYVYRVHIVTTKTIEQWSTLLIVVCFSMQNWGCWRWWKSTKTSVGTWSTHSGFSWIYASLLTLWLCQNSYWKWPLK
jgi:hypothetical protein